MKLKSHSSIYRYKIFRGMNVRRPLKTLVVYRALFDIRRRKRLGNKFLRERKIETESYTLI